jgi:hypothetical protein
MKFLETHWWVIVGIIVLYFYATRATAENRTQPFEGFDGGSMGGGVTGDY